MNSNLRLMFATMKTKIPYGKLTGFEKKMMDQAVMVAINPQKASFIGNAPVYGGWQNWLAVNVTLTVGCLYWCQWFPWLLIDKF